MFLLILVKGHHLQLRCHPQLFHNFRQFNIKAAQAHHPIIQKEVDEQLAKDAIELSVGGSGFCSNIFVVPKHTGGLQSIFNLKWFSVYMHILPCKMPTIRQVGQPIQHGNYASSFDLKTAYLDIPIAKHITVTSYFCLETQTLTVEGFATLAGYSLYVFHLTY